MDNQYTQEQKSGDFSPYMRLFSALQQGNQNPSIKPLMLNSELSLDDFITTEQMKLMKTFVPYLSDPYKKMFILYIKFMEFYHTLLLINSGEDLQQNDSMDFTSLFMELMPFMNPNQQNMMDLFMGGLPPMEHNRSSNQEANNPMDFYSMFNTFMQNMGHQQKGEDINNG